MAACVIGALLAVAAVAAAQTFVTGAPVTVPSILRDDSTATTGRGVALASTVSMPVLAPDPAGGPPWGLRVFDTTRGMGCVEIGRVVDGRLGDLGVDHAFSDDGRFHALPDSTDLLGVFCNALDANANLFLTADADDVPASGIIPLEACNPPGDTPAPHLPRCPRADERHLYYGTLGPGAESVTYTLDGSTHTIPTSGPQGAYLIVTPAGRGDTDSIDVDDHPLDPPFVRVGYRDGIECRIDESGPIPGPGGCPLPGFVAPAVPHPTPAQRRVTLHPHLYRSRGRWVVTVSFTAPIAVDNVLSSYWVYVRQIGGSSLGGAGTDENVRAGSRQSIEEPAYLPAGRYRLTAYFTTDTTPLNAFDRPGVRIGTAVITVPVALQRF